MNTENKMRTFIAPAGLVFLALMLTGCFITDLTAPRGKSVRIMSQNEPAAFRDEHKDFYLLYGVLPLWRTKPEEIIEREGLAEVRVQTEDTVSDAVINLITGLIVFPQTVVVEGNYAPEHGPADKQ